MGNPVDPGNPGRWTGVGISGFFSEGLQELAALSIAGILMLVLALIVRIWDGMVTKRVDSTTGGLSIAGIVILVVALVLICLAMYVVYAVLTGLTIL